MGLYYKGISRERAGSNIVEANCIRSFVLFTRCYWENRTTENEVGQACSTHNIMVWKPKVKGHLGDLGVDC
jgi:hypothetical protein